MGSREDSDVGRLGRGSTSRIIQASLLDAEVAVETGTAQTLQKCQSVGPGTLADADLWRSTGLYSEVRRLVLELYRVRHDEPWRIPTEELHPLLRAGEVVPPEVFLE